MLCSFRTVALVPAGSWSTARELPGLALRTHRNHETNPPLCPLQVSGTPAPIQRALKHMEWQLPLSGVAWAARTPAPVSGSTSRHVGGGCERVSYRAVISENLSRKGQ